MSTPHMLLPITHMVEVPGWVGVTVTVEPARPWALAEVER